MTAPKPKRKRKKKPTPLHEIVQTAKGLLDAGAAAYKLGEEVASEVKHEPRQVRSLPGLPFAAELFRG